MFIKLDVSDIINTLIIVINKYFFEYKFHFLIGLLIKYMLY